MAARCAVQRQLSLPASAAVDLESALALIEKGRQLLASRTTIKGFHTQAHSQIDNASRHLEKMTDQVDEVLRQAAEKLGR